MKKNKKLNLNKGTMNESAEISRIIKISIGVLIFLVLVYLLAAILKGEIKLKKDETPEVEVQYTEILAEQTFKQSDSTYYVLFYDFDDIYSDTYNLISNILSKVYKVDLGKKFNTNYIATTEEELITNPSNISQLKVKNPTLIKIVNGKVENFITGKDSIISYSKNK